MIENNVRELTSTFSFDPDLVARLQHLNLVVLFGIEAACDPRQRITRFKEYCKISIFVFNACNDSFNSNHLAQVETICFRFVFIVFP